MKKVTLIAVAMVLLSCFLAGSAGAVNPTDCNGKCLHNRVKIKWYGCGNRRK